MLQCRIWGRGTGNAGEWEALTQGTQGEKTNFEHATHWVFLLSLRHVKLFNACLRSQDCEMHGEIWLF